MTLGDMVDMLRITPLLVEIRDFDGYEICTCKTDSKGITPYLNYKVICWFPSHAPFKQCDFTVYVDEPVVEEIEEQHKTIYGYNIDELLIFAQMCRENNITEDDLHRFATDSSMMYQVICDAIHKEMSERLMGLIK